MKAVNTKHNVQRRKPDAHTQHNTKITHLPELNHSVVGADLTRGARHVGKLALDLLVLFRHAKHAPRGLARHGGGGDRGGPLRDKGGRTEGREQTGTDV